MKKHLAVYALMTFKQSSKSLRLLSVATYFIVSVSKIGSQAPGQYLSRIQDVLCAT